ncbi:MAG TPA: glucose-6-phosphate isomerase [Actinomycetota bacterium]|nr:glucose-6-phosphate isomerase [Actinomycetota bacterium]
MGVRTHLGELEDRVRARLKTLADDEVVGRIWARDHTVWKDEPTEIADRLGWLDAVGPSREGLGELRALADEVRRDGLRHVVLLGMGGSCLAAEVVAGVHRTASLDVLDTTHPDAIARLERESPLAETVFVVSSKSGTTIETRSHMAYFLDLAKDPTHFVAITDPGTELEASAEELGFRRVFRAPPDVGGRYSALTAFGLVPAILSGIDPGELLESAREAKARCLPDVPIDENPATVIGAALGEAALAGRDKATMAFADPLLPLGAWLEQLLAESTGKDGKGILPVDGEPVGPPEVYGDDRLFLTTAGAEGPDPSVQLPLRKPGDLGWAFFVLEFATAVAGAVVGIHPFDQPDVQSAKDRTAEVLAAGNIRLEPPGDVRQILDSVRPGDYVAIQAFVDSGGETARRLPDLRWRLRDRLRVATTLGFGPRYLHSTGQYHKGGPNTGVFLQVFEEPQEDRAVPGEDFSFGQLIAAQAAGDLAALRERGRRAARVGAEGLLAWEG